MRDAAGPSGAAEERRVTLRAANLVARTNPAFPPHDERERPGEEGPTQREANGLKQPPPLRLTEQQEKRSEQEETHRGHDADECPSSA